MLITATTLGPLIDGATKSIFRKYGEELMENSLAYLVTAVWGATRNDTLDTTQRQIYRYVDQIVEEIFLLFSFNVRPRSEQKAVEYLIRELFISRLIHMAESLKHLRAYGPASESEDAYDLRFIEPVGTA